MPRFYGRLSLDLSAGHPCKMGAVFTGAKIEPFGPKPRRYDCRTSWKLFIYLSRVCLQCSIYQK